MNYYNEFNPYAAQWLRNLIKAGSIPDGDVDDRSIIDVKPSDLHGYAQCHWFAGIAGWSLALRLADVPSDTPLWTGSAPCQPFSNAGLGGGFADERHLFPVWMELIRACRPERIFGEQVESAIGKGWLDLVFTELEKEKYSCGATVLGAHSVKSPHRRQRLYWVADSHSDGLVPVQGDARGAHCGWASGDAVPRGQARSMDDSELRGRRQQEFEHVEDSSKRSSPQSTACPVADSESHGICGVSGFMEEEERRTGLGCVQTQPRSGGSACAMGDAHSAVPQMVGEGHQVSIEGQAGIAGLGFWDSCEWIECRDGKARQTKPGLLPLAHGVPGRVESISAYGNAIVPQVAAQFIKAVMD